MTESPTATRGAAAPRFVSDGVAAISLDRVTKTFDGRNVVEDLTFDIGRGQILGLIGPSGCGKTTAVRMVMGVLAPDHGRVEVFGQEPRRFGNQIRQRMGYMPQHFVLYPELSVRENLDFVASCYGVPVRGRDWRLRRALELVELVDARDSLAEQISGGMQRRLLLACTLIHEPEILVVDEPTAGIDPVLRQKLWDHFRQLRDDGRSLLVTTQYVTEAEYCDTVAAMHDGRLVALGSPEDVRRDAIGGEVVVLHADGLTRARTDEISALDGVRDVRRVSADEYWITVDNAGAATPAIVGALQRSGIAIDEISEHRPTFDEVFVRLMADVESGSRENGANGAPQRTRVEA